MTTRELDALAKGPGEVDPPHAGARCPRCHHNDRRQPCRLCNYTEHEAQVLRKPQPWRPSDGEL